MPNDLALLTVLEENFKLAQTYCQRSAELHQKVNSPTGAMLPLGNLCYLALLNDEYEAAWYGEKVLLPAKTYL